jgi:spore germination cell wall hydrolase CwlJ-like protein
MVKNRSITVTVAAVFIIAAVLSSGMVQRAEATSTTKQQIQQAEEEKNALEDKLDESNDSLDKLKNTHNSLSGELNSLNNKLETVSSNLADIENQMQEKQQDIDDTETALEEAKATESWQYDCMVKRVREMYERNDTGYINAILGSSSIYDMVNAADCFEMVEAYDRKMLKQYEENRQLIEEQEARLKSDYAELENLKVAAEAEKSKVSGMISSTSNSIASYAGQISATEKEIEAYEEDIRQKEEDLTYLRKKLAEEIAMSKQAANSTWRDISEVQFADGDRYLLANLIYCEAGAEPYEGKVAVGSVVMNRVLSSVYPDTVVGVIYQSNQFSPVASGRLALALAEGRATQSCYDAADEAMSGVTNVGNCVYFRTPVEGLTGISIGGHIFY